ncbi:hypothetical protein ADIWIN_2473 [Winogradskyella psychrotolerans RS-3]|uniref:Uncharacterized protein n=2 Tax=Winogradskyella TaxID=286104 RepID=S7X971_9FLAO|nr:hypothetical protein ADIWIN_2473 [Winogradskyella psychrotolerans RS-3]
MFSLVSMFLMSFQCHEDDVILLPCGLEVVSDNEAYETSESDNYGVLNVDLSGDCLTVDVTTSGCDNNDWVLTLIDSENIAESMPSQRYLKLTLFNNQDCSVVLEKAETFDLSLLKVEGTNEVLLNIEGLSESVLYSY